VKRKNIRKILFWTLVIYTIFMVFLGIKFKKISYEKEMEDKIGAGIIEYNYTPFYYITEVCIVAVDVGISAVVLKDIYKEKEEVIK
jgi:hypothetical protein